jgi:phytoene synthase
MKTEYDHCEALVRERDRDRERFLSALFAPASLRPHLFALYAFDLEIAHVPDAVREPMAGEIRLQWWREALGGERSEEAKAYPVAAALLETMWKFELPQDALAAVIDARQFDLIGAPMESIEALERYFDTTCGKPIALASLILASAWESAEPARLAGRAIGYTRALRSLAHDVSRGRLLLPLDILAKHEVHTASVLGGESSDGLRAVLAELNEAARSNFDRLRAIELPQGVLPAFLPAALCPAYLTKIARVTDPFRAPVQLSALRAQFMLWRAARRGRL